MGSMSGWNATQLNSNMGIVSEYGCFACVSFQIYNMTTFTYFRYVVPVPKRRARSRTYSLWSVVYDKYQNEIRRATEAEGRALEAAQRYRVLSDAKVRAEAESGRLRETRKCSIRGSQGTVRPRGSHAETSAIEGWDSKKVSGGEKSSGSTRAETLRMKKASSRMRKNSHLLGRHPFPFSFQKILPRV